MSDRVELLSELGDRSQYMDVAVLTGGLQLPKEASYEVCFQMGKLRVRGVNAF